MKFLKISAVCAALLTGNINTDADTLRFSSGSLSEPIVSLTVLGPTNLVCELQRLNPTNDTWTGVGTFNLGGSGSCVVTSSVIDGYGYFRTKSTNGNYFS